ncbi:ABC transporter ATP-binding protein [Vibrio litoralis]|uniref:ABC transporter ATP-binding protein n=1 Tax=Vibrio litoralis TaxID=335972 RepID=UPI0003F64E60|nr:sn-glycerol-3-phosphate ABC transporter ATP-binding protein UgpC [Vibrio litoralis]
MAASIDIKNLSKRFDDLTILDDISFSIKENEFIVFLGPSGCGKSTLLRMIAGLEGISEGEIWMDDNRLDIHPPGQRDIAMVFQNYALYPHMTVEENMSFGLRNIGTSEQVIKQRVEEASLMLEMSHLLKRKPAELSGGQRQRVAIGRAIVREPKAFLFDEPLSNLDAALRSRTRIKLAQIHQRVKSTMIFVTHDQVEAMTLAHRIVVLNNKKIEQIGTPTEIYQRPATKFVAGFVGSPAMNFIPVQTLDDHQGMAEVHMEGVRPFVTTIEMNQLPNKDDHYQLGIRSEDLHIVDDPEQSHTEGNVTFIERLGERTLVYISLFDGRLIIADTSSKKAIEPNDKVYLAFDSSCVHLFDSEEKAYQGGTV